jgi:excinuclease UvrABC helicase subunit UvrB
MSTWSITGRAPFATLLRSEYERPSIALMQISSPRTWNLFEIMSATEDAVLRIHTAGDNIEAVARPTPLGLLITHQRIKFLLNPHEPLLHRAVKIRS